MKFIVVEGCSFSFSVGEGHCEINSSPSLNVTIGGKGVYRGVVNFHVTAFNGSGVTNGEGDGIFISTATNNFIDGETVLLEGDQGVCVVTDPLTQATATVTVSISNANQNVVIAD